MLISQAIIIGFIQGVTEFIPVSSTAHLTLAGRLMGIVKLDAPDGSEDWTAFIAVIQMGTLLAALVYFIPDIIHIAAGIVGKGAAVFANDDTAGNQGDWARLGWLLVAGSVPIGTAGLVFRDRIESKLTKNAWVIVWALLAVAVLLAIAEALGSKTREVSHLGVADAVVVGISQVFALVPGASRSGSTIATGLLQGLTREGAARFSFLLMLPAVAASGLFKLPGALRSMNVGRAQLAAGLVVAAVTGYLTIGITLGYLRSHTLYLFVVYRVAIAALVFWLLLSRRMPESS
jgi:undecaprenyl-diphosphatase